MLTVSSCDRDPAVAASRPLLRALAFAGVAVPASLIGHCAAGGSAPDDASLVLSLVIVAVLYRALLSRRERSWPVISAATASSQGLLHVLFGAGAQAGGQATSAGMAMSMPTGMDMQASGAVPGHLVSGLVMAACHLVAAVFLGWMLRCGESALWAGARRSAVTVILRPLRAVVASLVLGPVTPSCARAGGAVQIPDVAGRNRYRTTGGLLWRGPPVGGPTFI